MTDSQETTDSRPAESEPSFRFETHSTIGYRGRAAMSQHTWQGHPEFRPEQIRPVSQSAGRFICGGRSTPGRADYVLSRPGVYKQTSGSRVRWFELSATGRFTRLTEEQSQQKIKDARAGLLINVELPEAPEGNGKRWIKQITSFDPSQRGGYKLRGPFREPGSCVELPLDTLLVAFGGDQERSEFVIYRVTDPRTETADGAEGADEKIRSLRELHRCQCGEGENVPVKQWADKACELLGEIAPELLRYEDDRRSGEIAASGDVLVRIPSALTGMKRWTKAISGIDPAGKGGRRFEGHFVNPHTIEELPEGTVLLSIGQPEWVDGKPVGGSARIAMYRVDSTSETGVAVIQRPQDAPRSWADVAEAWALEADSRLERTVPF